MFLGWGQMKTRRRTPVRRLATHNNTAPRLSCPSPTETKSASKSCKLVAEIHVQAEVELAEDSEVGGKINDVGVEVGGAGDGDACLEFEELDRRKADGGASVDAAFGEAEAVFLGVDLAVDAADFSDEVEFVDDGEVEPGAEAGVSEVVFLGFCSTTVGHGPAEVGFDEEGFKELGAERESDAVGAFEGAVFRLLVLVAAFEEAVVDDVGTCRGCEAGVVRRVAWGAVTHVGAVAGVRGRG